MNPMSLLEGFGEIREKFVEEAENYRAKPQKIHLTRWISAAACLAVLAVSGAVYLRTNPIQTGDSASNAASSAASAAEERAAGDASGSPAPNAALFDASPKGYANSSISLDLEAYKPITEGSALLSENQLPEPITQEMLGGFIGTASLGELYAYAPLESAPAVRILEAEDGAFQYAFYTGPASTGAELFSLYGAASAEDLSYVALEGGAQGAASGDSQLLEEFYQLFASLESQGTPPEGTGELYLRVGFQNGLTFRIEYLEEEGLLCTSADAYQAGSSIAGLVESLKGS